MTAVPAAPPDAVRLLDEEELDRHVAGRVARIPSVAERQAEADGEILAAVGSEDETD
jgi:hypothetical protein